MVKACILAIRLTQQVFFPSPTHCCHCEAKARWLQVNRMLCYFKGNGCLSNTCKLVMFELCCLGQSILIFIFSINDRVKFAYLTQGQKVVSTAAVPFTLCKKVWIRLFSHSGYISALTPLYVCNEQEKLTASFSPTQLIKIFQARYHTKWLKTSFKRFKKSKKKQAFFPCFA